MPLITFFEVLGVIGAAASIVSLALELHDRYKDCKKK